MRLKVSKIDIRFGDYPLQKPFRISSGVIRAVPQMFVEADIVSDGKSVRGFGHNSIGMLWADRREMPLEAKERQLRKCAEKAAKKLRGFAFSTPFDFYKKFVLKNETELPNLAYVMALSPIDLALWDAYAKSRGRNVFDLPEVRKRANGSKPRKVRVVHLVGMDDALDTITRAISTEGVTLFKVKLGGNPQQDAARVNRIAKIKGVTGLSADANEAYGSPEDLRNFVSLLEKRALRKLLLIEQPFFRNSTVSVKNVGIKIPIFADESCADHRDIKKLHKLGYGGVALKPHTKTFSGTLLCLDELRKYRMAWTIMDLTTAPPIGYLVGLMCGSRISSVCGTELNGRQYYKNWNSLFALGFSRQRGVFAVREGFVRSIGLFEREGWGITESVFNSYRRAAQAY